MYVDTHVHLTDERYDDIEAVVDGYLNSGVDFVVNAGYDLQSSEGGKILSERFSSVYFAAGVHPSEANDFNSRDLTEIEKLLKHKKCVAYGEIGLDYHYDGVVKDNQIRLFLEQAELARAYDLPVVIHSRDCTEDMVSLITKNKKLFEKAVMHCYSGSSETAQIYISRGIYISFSGTVTFANAKNLKETAKIVPNELLLSETDCPYLAPVPFRGRLNKPENVVYVTKELARIRGQATEQTAAVIMQNARRLFNI